MMMPPETPVVLDTNVIVSAMLDIDSTPGRAFSIVFAAGDLPFSDATWQELLTTAIRPKFDRYASIEKRREFIERIQPVTFTDILRTLSICRDPSDDRVLEVALSVNADFLVTGDKDLISLDPFEGIRIVRPGDYLQRSGFVL